MIGNVCIYMFVQVQKMCTMFEGRGTVTTEQAHSSTKLIQKFIDLSPMMLNNMPLCVVDILCWPCNTRKWWFINRTLGGLGINEIISYVPFGVNLVSLFATENT